LFRRSRGVGDVNPKSVTWNFEQLSPRRRLLFSQPLPDDHKMTLSIPAVELQLEFSHRIVLIQISPGLDSSGLPFQPASESCHHDIGETPLFQKAQQGLIKEPRIRAHSPNSLTLRQKRQRFFQKFHPLTHLPRNDIPSGILSSNVTFLRATYFVPAVCDDRANQFLEKSCIRLMQC